MLRVLRRHYKFILIGTAVLVIPALVMWGGASRGSGGGSPGEREVVKVNGTPITEAALGQRVARMLQNLRDALGENYDPDLFGTTALTQRALSELIDFTLLTQESKRLRIRVTREAVEGRLRSWPSFYTDGEFDTTKYNQFVSRTDISWNNLYADLKAQIRREQLLGDVEGGARLSQSEIMNEYRLRNEQVKVRYLALNPSQFENEVAVTEEKLKDYYDKNRMSYFEPEKVKVKYVEAKIVPSDSDRQTVRDKARNVLAKAEAGEDFAELAKRYSNAPDASENSGDMGWMEESYLPDAVAAAVAQLENGELSDIVERQQDFYIYKCEGRKEEDGKKKV
ncbi:MAG: SurA N-terminal domain-containing protein, partial [Candidatus Hydrogenedentes bacterium]|nr:SurA N-terminal domain-containing protein [Candidatus Hydrogenedentota bacterium]